MRKRRSVRKGREKKISTRKRRRKKRKRSRPGSGQI